MNKMTNMNHDHIMRDIKATLDRAEPPLTEECCIYKVPSDIRKVNDNAYTPQVVSIGPFHQNSTSVQNMQRHKLVYCKHFLQRAEKESSIDLDTLVGHIEGAEQMIRRCYSETLDLTPEDLVKLVLVDSGFIFELFCRHYYDEWSQDDTLSLKPWLTSRIRLDLLLLENQLPFFVLDSLYTLAFGSLIAASRFPSFLKLTFNYFDYYNTCKISSINVTINHFTDLLRFFHLKPLEMLPVPHKKGRSKESMIHLQSATELSEAGLTFVADTENKCLLDLRFSGKVLRIPQLRVEDNTEILFRNLIALEQCHYPDESLFTDYVAVLDFLINTSKDVDVLVGKGILVNWLGDGDSVAKLFNSLWKNITYVNFGEHYFDICRDLDAFCRDTLHNLMATLWRDYGSTPWQAAATIAAIILLFLSLIQTICSVIQVVQQAKQK